MSYWILAAVVLVVGNLAVFAFIRGASDRRPPVSNNDRSLEATAPSACQAKLHHSCRQD